jgi:hypothetical protein
MRSALAILTVAPLLLCGPATARADKTDTCVAATVEGQRLQRAGKLIAARARFFVCANAECPSDVVSRCERWAQGASDLIPSIVLVTRDGAGHDLSDAHVTIDDRPTTAMSPHAIELDPGEHHVVFERSGAAPIEERVILHDAEKNRLVIAVFPSRESPNSTPVGPTVTTTRPVPARVWAIGGVGVLGLATFGVFAVKGASDRSANHCDTGCPTPQKESVDALLRAADIALAVGLVAVGVATWMYLTRPTVPSTPSSKARFLLDPAFVGLRW